MSGFTINLSLSLLFLEIGFYYNYACSLFFFFVLVTTDDLFSSNWVVEMDCPNVEVLILNISSPNFALPRLHCWNEEAKRF